MRYLHLWGWIPILFLTSGLLAGNFQEQAALVYADPARLEIGAGQTRTLHILLVNAQNVYGIDLQASFDPAVVEVVDADSRQAGVQMTSGKFPRPDFTVHNSADNQAGRLRYVVTQLNPTPPANGKGLVLSVKFRGKLQGSSSPLSFTSVFVADRGGNKQSLATQAAQLVVVRLQPATPTPTRTATGIFVAAVPTWAAPSLTPARRQSTATPGATATWVGTPTQPGSITAWNHLAWVPESAPAVSERVLTYVTVGGFSGAGVLAGLAVWLLVAKRHKGRVASSQ